MMKLKTKNLKLKTQNSKGFTLLEVLIAVSVLAISLMGVYTLMRTNIDIAFYAEKRITLAEAGGEMLHTLFAQEEIEPTPIERRLKGHEGVYYRIEVMPIGIAGIKKYRLTIEKRGLKIEYRFFR
ncbi:prepilin-type N-terminal cleavage/methylation domain-containing protein [Thermodesulfovibrionales bacterium]|nr:prepilin-type N-terminal cleavage/methylation domain-containing protein [Thermodesulfovibrionales bacterium]